MVPNMEQNHHKDVINYSSHILTKDQLKVLNKGLKFCPTPDETDPGQNKNDLDAFHRRLRLLSKFETEVIDDNITPTPLVDKQNLHCKEAFQHHNFKPPSKFNPQGPPTLEAMILANEADLNNRPEYAPKGNNLTYGEKQAIKELFQLQQEGDLIIRASDKGGALILQDRQKYLAEGHRQLSDTSFYQKLDHNPTEKHRREVQDFIGQMLTQGEIDISVYNYLSNKECRTSQLYLAPKTHKGILDNGLIPSRPILSANSSACEKISQLVDHFLRPPTTKLRSYIKDTTHFLQKLEELGTLPDNSYLVTLDVVSLYTKMPNDLTIQAATSLLQTYRLRMKNHPINH